MTMQSQDQLNYERIARAIEYLHANFCEQPGLEEVARHVHLSPYHFQRLFTEWAGTSPKKFVRYLSLDYARALLRRERASVSATTYELGFSSTSRLHDLFVRIEGMTPAEYRDGGAGLAINYSFADSPFGGVLVAATPKGVCWMAFAESKEGGVTELRGRFPRAKFQERTDALQQGTLEIFKRDWTQLPEIKLHLRGTDFQLRVWESLLSIPVGGLTTYGDIAGRIERPGASRAVGTAIGRNPVAYLIPCHRVIQATGGIGGYMWGPTRKAAMIGWEAVVSER